MLLVSYFLTIKSKNSRQNKFLLTRSWIRETAIMFQSHWITYVFTISLPINIIFPLSVVYGIMGACLYYVVTHVCMYECIHECMYISVYIYMHVCMYQNKKMKSKIFYSHKTVTLINMNNISNTVICKSKATGTQKGEYR